MQHGMWTGEVVWNGTRPNRGELIPTILRRNSKMKRLIISVIKFALGEHLGIEL